jgi:hypothetical protein
MSQVFKVWISECPSFWVKHYGNPSITTNKEFGPEGQSMCCHVTRMKDNRDTNIAYNCSGENTAKFKHAYSGE